MTSCMLQAAQAMGQAALSMAGMPGTANAAAALLQQGQAAAMRAGQAREQKKALQAAREKNEQQKEKRQDDLVNGAAVSKYPNACTGQAEQAYCKIAGQQW